jgi:hypothetical protein
MKNDLILTMPLTKTLIENMANSLSDMAADGYIKPLELHIKAKAAKDMIEKVIAKTLPIAMAELDRHGKSTNMFGCHVTEKEAGVKYDYTNTQEWIEIKNAEEAIIEKRKALEKQLIPLKDVLECVNPDTGEVLVRRPPIKSSTTTIVVEIPKS